MLVQLVMQPVSAAALAGQQTDDDVVAAAKPADESHRAHGGALFQAVLEGRQRVAVEILNAGRLGKPRQFFGGEIGTAL